MEFKDRVTARMKALGLSATDISRLTGVSKATVSFWVSGTNGAKGKNLLALAKALDCSPDWLSEGTGLPETRPTDNSKVGMSTAELVAHMLSSKAGKNLSEKARETMLAAAAEADSPAVTSNVITGDFSRPGLVGDEVLIAHYDIRGAMGAGQSIHDFPEMLKDIRVSPSHLRELGVEFEEHYHLKLVTGWGQSMEPTIKHRDPLIVNIHVREFAGDGIYLFFWDDHVYIKRLQVADEDHFEMISDNTRHKDRLIRRDMTYIQARVLLVWNAHLL